MFVTGTDEHGQKIATTAEKLGKTPLAICDYYADEFKVLKLSGNREEQCLSGSAVMNRN